ncbi:HAMP domain-containing sensor histidine kinase [Sphingomonas sp. GC_Shp_3]|uniref:sensor histidine kinase n=1 Tax=Sphingomonas sp. GC_Shp_3 TaxID=2937383 RepID=UPI00226AEDD3|nr:HAMP domain-containing sensor histidine kinase [Sphingomonas sp. GC_Shp_3]
MRIAAPRSLLAQFVVLHVAVAVVATVVLLWSATTLLHQTADHFQRNLLRQQVEIVAAARQRGEQKISPTVLSAGMAVTVIDRDRRIDGASGPARPDVLAAAPLSHHPRFFRHGDVEGFSQPVGGGWIVASQDDTDPQVVTDDIVRSFLKRFALITVPIAALVPLIGVVLARRLTLRMRRVSATAAAIGPSSSDIRLPIGLLPLEAEPLAEATNAALDRLADALHVQTAFAADVAHELRTPLAVIRLRADAIENRAVQGEMIRAVDRAARVITQLLVLAELEQPSALGMTAVALDRLAENVVADRAPAIFAGQRTIALDAAANVPPIEGYSEAIALALGNLIDNATKYTPTGTAIVVCVGPGAQLSVSDDGIGVPDAHLSRLKDRLWRGSPERIEGSGIGLSIVDRIARAHGGGLAVERGPGGTGLTARITLFGEPAA